jgi:hypothetical protein
MNFSELDQTAKDHLLVWFSSVFAVATGCLSQKTGCNHQTGLDWTLLAVAVASFDSQKTGLDWTLKHYIERLKLGLKIIISKFSYGHHSLQTSTPLNTCGIM